jgi:hypothetical protein
LQTSCRNCGLWRCRLGSTSSGQTKGLPDLSRRLRIDLPRRHRCEFVAHENHGVSAFAAPRLDPEGQASRSRFVTQFIKKSLPFVHFANS